MTSAKYMGYVGGAAVAAGVGVAIAVGGQGTAHAETDAPSSETRASSSETRASSHEVRNRVERRLAAAEKRVETRLARATERRAAVEKRLADVDKKLPKFDPAEAVDNLKKQFSAVKAPKLTVLKSDSVLAGKATETARALTPTSSVDSSVDTTAEPSTDAPFTNPLRSNDPDPTPAGMYDPVLRMRDVILGVTPDFFDPLVREGFEAGYRVSQMIPWVNLPIPLLQIADGAIAGDQRITQVAINQLLLTLPGVGILYYGYDLIADLLNVEVGAARFKENLYRTAWDTIDFLGILHTKGQSGLPQ
jgi:hypothetical protein